MNINFTGVKNIGYFNRQFVDDNEFRNLRDDVEVENENYYCLDEKFLTVQLTDDYNGKDLTEFKKAISTSDLKRKYPNPVGNDFLNIFVEKEEYKKDLTEGSKVSYFINGEELKINDKNLKFISYVSKLMKKISQTPENKLVYNRDFVNGEEADKAIILGVDLIDTPFYFAKNDIYSPSQAISGSKLVFNEIQDTMMDYFA